MTIVAMVFSASVMTGCGQTISTIDPSGLISLIHQGPMQDMPTERKKPATIPNDVDHRRHRSGPPARPGKTTRAAVPVGKKTAKTVTANALARPKAKAQKTTPCGQFASAKPCSANSTRAWIPEPVRNPTVMFSTDPGGGYGGLR